MLLDPATCIHRVQDHRLSNVFDFCKARQHNRFLQLVEFSDRTTQLQAADRTSQGASHASENTHRRFIPHECARQAHDLAQDTTHDRDERLEYVPRFTDHWLEDGETALRQIHHAIFQGSDPRPVHIRRAVNNSRDQARDLAGGVTDDRAELLKQGPSLRGHSVNCWDQLIERITQRV